MGKTRPKKQRKKQHKTKKGQSFWIVIIILLLIIIALAYYVFIYQKYDDPFAFQPKRTEKQTQHSAPGKVSRTYKDLHIPQYTIVRKDEQVITHTGYTVSYNQAWRLPNWVSYELSRSKTKGAEKRTDKFIANPKIKATMATNSDYLRSGFDKGHMVPAADMKWSSTAMEESFYFSNVCPQHPELNRRKWKDLEAKVREWAQADSAIIVVCGPIVNRKSKTIGKNRVTVPEGFFKVILSPYIKTPQAVGFIFKNERSTEPLRKYVVTVDSVESVTGMDFFSSLPDDLEKTIEANVDTNRWGI